MCSCYPFYLRSKLLTALALVNTIMSVEISHSLAHICIHYSSYSLIFLPMITPVNKKKIEHKWGNWWSCQVLFRQWLWVSSDCEVSLETTFISQLKQPHRPSFKHPTLLQSLSSLQLNKPQTKWSDMYPLKEIYAKI